MPSLRSIIILALALIAGCAHAPGPRAATPSPPTGRAVAISVLGDSLAFGTGASEPTGGFAFRLYESIERERPGSEITSDAIGGTTVADVLRLEAARLRGTHPDLIILCVGGNDVVRRTDPRAFARAYSQLVDTIRNEVPHAKLVLFGVPNVATSPLFADFDARAIALLSLADDTAVRANAARTGAGFVDLFALSQSAKDRPGFFSSDQFHPSDDGHERIAALARPTIERALAAVTRVHPPA
jgi:lysophospholipase L1-like esterase